MKNWIIKNKLLFIGAALGAVAGFLYWKFIGCVTGTCAITSNPYNSTIYFASLGALIFGFFKGNKKEPGMERNNNSLNQKIK